MKDVSLELLEKLLRQLMDILADASSAELKALQDGRSVLVVQHEKDARPKPPRKREQPALSIPDIDQIIERLRQCTSRDDGLAFLAERSKTKEDLLRVARRLDIPIPRDATVDRAQQHIIEATIGYKLRSDAIQNR